MSGSRCRAAAFRDAALVLAVLLLVGCATRVGPRPSAPPADAPVAPAAPVDAAPPIDSPEAFAALAARDAILAPRDRWTLRGRMALARGAEGGTLAVVWRQAGASFEATLSAPVTGRQWRLRGDATGAWLEGLEGGPRAGPDAETLLLEATGWRLPVQQMPDWVRGRRGAGPIDGLAVDADGRPRQFRQGDWTLRYRDWWPGDPALPRRVFAETEGASVRLVVTGWQDGP